ncbi:MAG: peptidoglycan DD-metalloendopeptidase family protein [Alphaproteobacteria bacterium]|nr:peptidoglycan DD-metalloendopeptidase family protein [Alphaproteobacteria bacterium]
MRRPSAERSLLLAAALSLACLPAAAAEKARLPSPSKLQVLEKEIASGMEHLEDVQAEANTLQEELSGLRRRLVEAASAVQAREAAVAEAEEKLANFRADEVELKARVDARRESLSAALAALQMLRLNEPPALVVKPDDAVAAARSAMLLGSVVPVLREDVQTLAAQMEELSALRQEIEIGRDSLLAATGDLMTEQKTLASLIAEKEKARRSMADALAAEGNRLAAMTKEARALRERLAEIESEARARAPREKPPEEKKRLAGEPRLRGAEDTEAARTASLAPRAPLMPARGRVLHAFGQPDGAGGRIQGMMMRTLNGAQIVSPTAGKLAFAGPVPGYGQMLIIAAPGGYHVILAGLERIYGNPGQALLAGEPVGAMGQGADGRSGPELYVEIRKNGAPIDPMTWLATSEGNISG